MVRLSSASVIVILIACSLAQSMLCQGVAIPWAPPKYNFFSSSQSKIPHEIIRSLRLADMQIVLEKTTLKQVQKRFGGAIGRRGDAGNSEGWLCYQGSDAAGKWILWLTSDEMHGVTEISDFQWRLLKSDQTPGSRCKQLPSDGNEIELAQPIRIGATQEQILKVLGKPSTTGSNSYYYTHEHPATFHNEACTVWNGVTVEFSEGVVAVIEGGLLSSC
jgi:hypothetical protein